LGEEGEGYLWIQNNIFQKTELVQDEEQVSLVLDETDSEAEEEEDKEEEYKSDRDRFLMEVIDCIKNATSENKSIEMTKQDLRFIKYAYNSSFLDVSEGLLISIFTLSSEKEDGMSSIKELLEKWSLLFPEFIENLDTELELIFKLLDYCFLNSNFKKLFGETLRTMFEVGIVQDRAIILWAGEQEENLDGEDKIFYEQALPLINSLKKNNDTLSYGVDDIEDVDFQSKDSLSEIEEVPFNEDEDLNFDINEEIDLNDIEIDTKDIKMVDDDSL